MLGDMNVVDPIFFSSGSVVVVGAVQGNLPNLNLTAPARLLHGQGSPVPSGTGSVYHFIPLDLQTITPMGALSDYYYRFATTTTVVDTTVTFQADGNIRFDRGAGGTSVLVVPAGSPVVVSNGTMLSLQGEIHSPVTVVAAAIGAGEGSAVVIGNLTYYNDPAKPAAPNATLAVLADRLVFRHQIPGNLLFASGFYYGANKIEVESPTTVRGVVYSGNGIITTSSHQPLNINYDAALTTATPHFLPEQPEVVDFKLQKPWW